MTSRESDHPRVTVLMPVHNGGQYLDASVRSIFNQTYDNFELLVIDDGSTDGSAGILRAYRDLRLKIVENSRNLGVVETLNRGLSLSRGEYIARMDSDDESLPERLERQVSFLDAHPEIGVLGTSGELIDREGRSLAVFRYPLHHEAICYSLHFYNPLAHPSVMIRREVVLKAGGYLPRGASSSGGLIPEDYELWCRLSPVTRLANLPDRLFLLRKHGRNVSMKYGEEFRVNAARINRDRIEAIIGQNVSVAVAESMMSRRYEPVELANEAFRTIVRLYHAYIQVGLSKCVEREIRRKTCEELVRIALYRGNLFRLEGLFSAMARLDPTFRVAGRHLLQRIEAKVLGKPLPD